MKAENQTEVFLRIIANLRPAPSLQAVPSLLEPLTLQHRTLGFHFAARLQRITIPTLLLS